MFLVARGSYALSGILLFLLSRYLNDNTLILTDFSMDEEILEDRNPGASVVRFGSYGASALILFLWLHDEIDRGNFAAGIGFSGALGAIGIIVMRAVSVRFAAVLSLSCRTSDRPPIPSLRYCLRVTAQDCVSRHGVGHRECFGARWVSEVVGDLFGGLLAWVPVHSLFSWYPLAAWGMVIRVGCSWGAPGASWRPGPSGPPHGDGCTAPGRSCSALGLCASSPSSV